MARAPFVALVLSFASVASVASVASASSAASAASTAAIDAPAVVEAGRQVPVVVSGSARPRDFVTIVPKGAPEGRFEEYRYVGAPTPASLPAPRRAGTYELRVLGAESPYPTLARRELRVRAAAATLDAPAEVPAGRDFEVRWSGPANPKDYLAIGDATRPYLVYRHAREGSPLRLRAPEAPGTYEVRYFLGEGDEVIARSQLTVTPVTATVQPPATAVAGHTVLVPWTGPNNPRDYLTVVPKGAREGESGEFAYTSAGSPARLVAPLAPGEYEIRYALAQTQATLARAPLRVTGGAQDPGMLRVTGTARERAVLLILDASGSMLQRLGGERRIDIARRTLTALVTSQLAPGTPFALRAFGRRADSCRTDLVMPLAPLDAAAASSTLGSLDARNGARTPIGASLERAADDLKDARGERTIVLVTDGEETCGGDPAAAIEGLQRGAPAPVVNVVGFAVDEARIAATFRHWAALGHGGYFDARDAAGLERALAEAVQPRFELVDARGDVVVRGRVGGEPVPALPGTYELRFRGTSAAARPVEILAKQTTAVAL